MRIIKQLGQVGCIQLQHADGGARFLTGDAQPYRVGRGTSLRPRAAERYEFDGMTGRWVSNCVVRGRFEVDRNAQFLVDSDTGLAYRVSQAGLSRCLDALARGLFGVHDGCIEGDFTFKSMGRYKLFLWPMFEPQRRRVVEQLGSMSAKAA